MLSSYQRIILDEKFFASIFFPGDEKGCFKPVNSSLQSPLILNTIFWYVKLIEYKVEV